MKANEEKIEHLKLIQQVINRLAGNSFLIKGWTLTISLAGLGFYFSNKNKAVLVMLALGIILFWFFDSYYLRQERLFRKLFEKTVDSSDVKAFSMNTKVFENQVEDILCVALSYPTFLIYLPLIIVLALLLFSIIKI